MQNAYTCTGHTYRTFQINIPVITCNNKKNTAIPKPRNWVILSVVDFVYVLFTEYIGNFFNIYFIYKKSLESVKNIEL